MEWFERIDYSFVGGILDWFENLIPLFDIGSEG